MHIRTDQRRGYMSRAGYQKLDQVLGSLCDLGNAALQERRDAWRLCRKPISFYDQCKSLTGIREDDPDGFGSLSSVAERGALQRVDRAFKAFFQRCKKGEKPGYPRFRSRYRYETIEIGDVSPSLVRRSNGKTKIRVKGLGQITVARELPEQKPRSIRIVRRSTGISVDLVYRFEPELDPAPSASAVVGIDMGVRKRLTLSTEEIIELRPETDLDNKIKETQRSISRCKRQSWTRRKRILSLRRLKRKKSVRNRNVCHRITSSLIKRFGTVVVEKLQIRNMTRSAAGTQENPGVNVAQKRGLNRSILAQSWGMILSQLKYKAEWAGRRVVEVDPRYTSQICSNCQVRGSPGSSEIWKCYNCGIEHDRDVNAAINIKRAGGIALGGELCNAA